MLIRFIGKTNTDKICPAGFTAEAKRCLKAYGRYFKKSSISGVKEKDGPGLFIIDDTHQTIGAFKIRGAAVAIGEKMRFQKGSMGHVYVASSGSFGMATATIASQMGLKASVFMPVDVPQTKKNKIINLGAKVIAKYST